MDTKKEKNVRGWWQKEVNKVDESKVSDAVSLLLAGKKRLDRELRLPRCSYETKGIISIDVP